MQQSLSEIYVYKLDEKEKTINELNDIIEKKSRVIFYIIPFIIGFVIGLSVGILI